MFNIDAEKIGCPDVRRIDITGLPENVYAVMLRCRYGAADNEVFAYVGIPQNYDVNKKLPAAVLVHGGGGRAFYKWAHSFSKRGYISIAPDFSGTMDKDFAGNIAPNNLSYSLGKNMFYYSAGGNCESSWTYQGVLTILSAHNYLKSLPFTDTGRTGIAGISWGGVLSLISLGLDKSFSAAAIIYSAGFIMDDLLGRETGLDMFPERKEFYERNLDPQDYIKGSKIPAVFNAGCDDAAFSVISRKKTYDLLEQKPHLCIERKLLHDNESNFDNKNVFAFFDRHLKGENTLITLSGTAIENNKIINYIDGHGIPVERCVLLYTDMKDSNPHKWDWREAEASLEKDKIVSVIPAAARAAMHVVYYNGGLYVSSDIIFFNE